MNDNMFTAKFDGGRATVYKDAFGSGEWNVSITIEKYSVSGKATAMDSVKKVVNELQLQLNQ